MKKNILGNRKKFELYDDYKKLKEYVNTNLEYNDRNDFYKTKSEIKNFINDLLFDELEDSTNEDIDKIKKELLNNEKNTIKSKFSFFSLKNNKSRYKEVKESEERELKYYKELKKESNDLINEFKEKYDNTVGGNLKKLKKNFTKKFKKNRKTKNDKLTRRLIKKIKKTKKTKNNYKKYK